MPDGGTVAVDFEPVSFDKVSAIPTSSKDRALNNSFSLGQVMRILLLTGQVWKAIF